MIGLQAGLDGPVGVAQGDVCLWLENDDSWIDGDPPGDGGLFVGVPRRRGSDLRSQPSARPCDGRRPAHRQDLRPAARRRRSPWSRSRCTRSPTSAPAAPTIAGGAQLQLTNLAVSAVGRPAAATASPPASSRTPATRRRSRRSPRRSRCRSTAAQPVVVTLRAGDGDGPGGSPSRRASGRSTSSRSASGVEMRNQRVDEHLGASSTGRCRCSGSPAPSTTSRSPTWSRRDDFFDPHSWTIDLAGLAVSRRHGRASASPADCSRT